jgi:hypothetical protein
MNNKRKMKKKIKCVFQVMVIEPRLYKNPPSKMLECGILREMVLGQTSLEHFGWPLGWP